MAATFKALAALLTYPTAELQAAAVDIGAVIAGEGLVAPAARRALAALITDLDVRDLYDLQERYVEQFDKTRRLSLNLFEHVHGESRDRGQAMVDLAHLYEADGLSPAGGELPDYLPLFLEFLSTRPLAAATALLADTAPILAALGDRLAERASPYAAVFRALVGLAGAEAVAPADLAEPGDLDAEWEEAAVTFGPGAARDGCSTDRLRTRLRAARRDVRGDVPRPAAP
jgi:nitrate reductase delta subunit